MSLNDNNAFFLYNQQDIADLIRAYGNVHGHVNYKLFLQELKVILSFINTLQMTLLTFFKKREN